MQPVLTASKLVWASSKRKPTQAVALNGDKNSSDFCDFKEIYKYNYRFITPKCMAGWKMRW